MDFSPPGSSVHGISQARILKQVAISSSRDLPGPGIEPTSPALVGGFFTTEPPGKTMGVIACSIISVWKELRGARMIGNGENETVLDIGHVYCQC